MGRAAFLVDTDPGTDDAISLMMVLGSAERRGIDLLGITTVGGNASLARTTRNTLALLEYAGHDHIPVARGSARPLKGSYPYAYYFHGPGGISVRLPAPGITAVEAGAVEFLRDRLLAVPDGVTLVALGPLTNLAKLLRRYPKAWARLGGLVVMGGAVDVAGNVTPHAEFNFFCDALAADLVLSSGVEVTLVDLSVCRQASISRKELSRLLRGGASAMMAGRILSNWFRRNPEKETYELCDPLAMAVAMEPGIITTHQAGVRVETEDPERMGQSTSQGAGSNVRVSAGLDTQRFFEVFYSALS